MSRNAVLIVAATAVCLCGVGRGQQGNQTSVPGKLELVRFGQYSAGVRVEPARFEDRAGLALIFDGSKELHYYARKATAPGGYNLRVEASSKQVDFAEPIFPAWQIFRDPTGIEVEVYSGRFVVFVPFKEPVPATKAEVEIRVSGIACTSTTCLKPFEDELIRTTIDLAAAESWRQISFVPATSPPPAGAASGSANYPLGFALVLALLAGLSLNIMPCVWPVLPLIIMRLVQQARQSKGKSIAMGLAFCVGILLFFACLAGANIILRVFYGQVLQWGIQFQNPVFLTFMVLLLVVLALFMFGVFTITVPSSVASKAGAGSGYLGSVGMGFLAAILATPCSFAILAAAVAWAQSQPPAPATAVLMTIGVGMAVPYAVLTAMPSLLKRLPTGGRWMELFKQALGFLLLGIAAFLFTALPQDRRAGVLYFSIVLGLCVWIWGSWVRYDAALWRKLAVRGVAVVLAIGAGMYLLGPKGDVIEWQPYDAAMIKQARADSRAVLIKFTADWCLSCKVVDKLVYSRRDLAELIKQKNVLAVRADVTTADGLAGSDLQRVYGEPGVPVTILFLPGKAEPIRWHGKLFADELKEHLEQLH